VISTTSPGRRDSALGRRGSGHLLPQVVALTGRHARFAPPFAAPAKSPLTIPGTGATALWRRAISWAADRESAGLRRRLQLALGVMWLLDAALQFQPPMFGRAFVTQVLAPAAAGNPAALARPALWASRLIGQDVPAINTLFALIQLAFAVGLL
jgi:hypothetical protein